MERNEGTVDRILRIVIGLILIIAGSMNYIPFGLLFAVIGVVLIFTGVTGFCALYKIFGIKTCSDSC